MGCFWTDFVGCVEDCGDAPVSNSTVLMGLASNMGSGGSGAGDAIPYIPATGVRIAGALQFDTVTVYSTDSEADFAGCSWKGFIATTDAALAGTSIDDCYNSQGVNGYSVTWKLVSDFTKVFLASGANVALSAAEGGGSFINTNDLLTALGSPSYDNSGLLIVATLRNVDTDETWEATWALDTCS